MVPLTALPFFRALLPPAQVSSPCGAWRRPTLQGCQSCQSRRRPKKEKLLPWPSPVRCLLYVSSPGSLDLLFFHLHFELLKESVRFCALDWLFFLPVNRIGHSRIYYLQEYYIYSALLFSSFFKTYLVTFPCQSPQIYLILFNDYVVFIFME